MTRTREPKLVYAGPPETLIGRRVYSESYGYGQIILWDNRYNKDFPITVKFEDNSTMVDFTADGYEFNLRPLTNQDQFFIVFADNPATPKEDSKEVFPSIKEKPTPHIDEKEDSKESFKKAIKQIQKSTNCSVNEALAIYAELNA